MCYICSCFAWLLDFAQRVLTFGLTCILCFAICFGLAIATLAGIAYGYNYSMAEFLTFTRSDVTVYMKRGQFSDASPSLMRRSGSQDMFPSNHSMDYEESKPSVRKSKPLADTWMKSQDTRKYAEILTKYNPSKKLDIPEPEAVEPSSDQEYYKPVVQPRQHILKSTLDTPIISMMPNPLIPTVSWRSGSSKIMMRNFQPLQDHMTRNRHTDRPDTLFPTRSTGPPSIPILSPQDQDKGVGEGHKKYIPMRMWGTTARAVIPDEPEEVDEDNIVYRPV